MWHSKYTLNINTGIMTWASTRDIAHGAAASATSTASGSSPSYAADALYTTEWKASTTFPQTWSVDLGSNQSLGEINIAWPMIKGSEAYYEYKLMYSTDGTNYTTVDRTSNQFYGFTNDTINLTARYLKVELDKAVIWNNPNDYYAPAMWEFQVLGPQ